ncbi:hypothetical protein GTP46_27850 [Duganella sp. FT135W]|uniref:Chalcone isomerase domain-containing protein n=1 Tax=Duganella flavida TaxID=2692175 RepID=A0A6L8KI64_9BURK|nr:chalcone isomerase family protein [Duganella flavida]MYM26447.1 hypothetical protein [Duganella flavida]
MWFNSSCTSAKRRRLLGAALLCAFMAAANATAGVADWRALLPQAQALGGGDMTWFGLRIYRATLWSASRPFDAAQPFALQLSYYRSISRERLVRTSIDEIRRLSPAPLPAPTLTRWEALLNTAFVDVADGDELTGVYLPGSGMRLYDRQRLLAEVNDEALARAFFDIWLNPDSRDQRLRQRLIGAQP